MCAVSAGKNLCPRRARNTLVAAAAANQSRTLFTAHFSRARYRPWFFNSLVMSARAIPQRLFCFFFFAFFRRPCGRALSLGGSVHQRVRFSKSSRELKARVEPEFLNCRWYRRVVMLYYRLIALICREISVFHSSECRRVLWNLCRIIQHTPRIRWQH